jgi:hypothetical protein
MNQRWRERRESYRPAQEPIDPSKYGVELIREQDAKAYVIRHHYSGTYPAARLRVGLFRSLPFNAPALVGVAVFSVPMVGAVISKWLGVEPAKGVELGRFVLNDDVEGNGETWFLARAFRLLARELQEVEGVVSMSDPVQRRSAFGDVVTPGHVGTIYQALNGRFVGRSKPKKMVLDQEGRALSERALSKIRNDECGARYAYDQLLDSGAPRREFGETGEHYIARALRDGPFVRVAHPGNIVYVWATERASKMTVQGLRDPMKYLKARDAVVCMEREVIARVDSRTCKQLGLFPAM